MMAKKEVVWTNCGACFKYYCGPLHLKLHNVRTKDMSQHLCTIVHLRITKNWVKIWIIFAFSGNLLLYWNICNFGVILYSWDKLEWPETTCTGSLIKQTHTPCDLWAKFWEIWLTLCMLGNLSSAKMSSAEFLKLAFSLIFFKEYYQNSKQFGSRWDATKRGVFHRDLSLCPPGCY